MLQTEKVTAAPDYSTYRSNKTIPKIIENEVLKALSFYPELRDTCIHFVFKRRIRKSVMQAQPKFSTMLSGKREYNINISAMFRLTTSAIPIHQIPSDIMVGWIGHELGHIMDYESKSVAQMARFGLGYLFSASFIKQAERAADTYAVNHGLGRYIVQTKHFILNHANLSEKYKSKIARLYLSPNDIIEQVRKLEEAELKAS
ncbi:hypothetical protein [Dyadobacter luticola]|uniref:M48 family metallopeptidase n=1 Tax=Dyadobacter luticola TaxID=1979387 RepID=A0A5R9KVF3_9BACT|nr:hypothetical protein [Dyadobacter luticola]TLV00221.1 hypothetical protein FEN17_11990 [Dyadobacter luticola]